jgi:hypothetical protein
MPVSVKEIINQWELLKHAEVHSFLNVFVPMHIFQILVMGVGCSVIKSLVCLKLSCVQISAPPTT